MRLVRRLDLGSWPANGDLFTMKDMRTVGSSIAMGVIGFGSSLSTI
jgi:hypothetical protein